MAQYFLCALGIVILMLMLTLNLNSSALNLLKLLTNGDVESNPEPIFKLIKVIEVSYLKVTQHLEILLGYNVPVARMHYVGLLLNALQYGLLRIEGMF